MASFESYKINSEMKQEYTARSVAMIGKLGLFFVASCQETAVGLRFSRMSQGASPHDIQKTMEDSRKQASPGSTTKLACLR